jgi:hypothetical protein
LEPEQSHQWCEVKLDADRRKLATILLVQSDFATAILETAGRKDKNPLGDALEATVEANNDTHPWPSVVL